MEIPSAVARRLQKMLPESYVDDVTSFAFVPNFPDWPGKPDLIAATKLGELVEFKDRGVVVACSFSTRSMRSDVVLHYGKSYGRPPSYIVSCDGEAFVFNKDEVSGELRIVKKFSDVTKVVLDDANSTGESNIRIWRHDETIPIVLDNTTFEVLADDNFSSEEMFSRDDDELSTLLMNKLSEARLNTVKNRKIYEEKRKFRQKISHIVSEDARYEVDDAMARTELPRFDRLVVGDLQQRVHNGKWIIFISVENITHRSITGIELLLKSDDAIFTYDTGVYAYDATSPPFWLLKEKEANMKGETAATVVAVSQMPTFEHSGRTNLTAAVRYEFEEKTYCIPLSRIEIKASDVVNSRMDPILNRRQLDPIDLLAVASAGLTTEMNVCYVSMSPVNLEEIFVKNLKFTRSFDDVHPVLLHADSPLDILHGTVVRIMKNVDSETFSSDKIIMSVMNESKLSMFINLMYELIPVRCAIVPSNCNVQFKKGVPKRSGNKNESEDIDMKREEDSLSRFSSNLSDQMSEVSRYLEKCTEAMTELNIDRAFDKETTMNINVTALGNDVYQQLWNRLKQFMSLQSDILKETL